MVIENTNSNRLDQPLSCSRTVNQLKSVVIDTRYLHARVVKHRYKRLPEWR